MSKLTLILGNQLFPLESINLDKDSRVTSGTISSLNNAMKGMNIGVTVATIHEDFANKYLDSNLKVYPTQDEMNLDLAAGRIDAMLCDVGTAEAFMETSGGSNVVTFGPNVFGGLLGEGVGAGIRQGDADLKAMFDKAIADAAVAAATLPTILSFFVLFLGLLISFLFHAIKNEINFVTDIFSIHFFLENNY